MIDSTTPITLSQVPRLATAEEMAEALGVRLHRLYALAREGDLPCIRLGRSMRFDPRAVASWLANGGTVNRDGGTAG